MLPRSRFRPSSVSALLALSFTGLTLSVTSAACSSSSPSGTGNPDSGAAHDSATKHDTGAQQDTGAQKDTGGGGDTGSGEGGACAPMDTSSFMPTTFVPATGHQGVCTTTQINDFINACVMGTTSCATWQEMNLMIDGGPGTPCGNCILPNNTDDNGALWLDPTGSFWPNYGACVQVLDPTNGPACAQAYDNASGCSDIGCDSRCTGMGSCSTNADCSNCFKAVETGSCKSYVATVQTECKPAAAALTSCSPSAKTGEQASDFAFIAEVICGSGGDAGATDSGKD